MPKIHSKDLIAIGLILMFGILKLAGKDGALDPAMMLLVGYYFAKRNNGEDNGN